MKKWKNSSMSQPIVNLFVTLRQSDSSFEEKMVNYWAEIYYILETEKMLYCTQ